MYLSHRMQSLFSTRFTGYALTVRMEKQENRSAHDRAVDILNLAQQLDFKEHSMYPLIEKTKSIESVVSQFGRL